YSTTLATSIVRLAGGACWPRACGQRTPINSTVIAMVSAFRIIILSYCLSSVRRRSNPARARTRRHAQPIRPKHGNPRASPYTSVGRWHRRRHYPFFRTLLRDQWAARSDRAVHGITTLIVPIVGLQTVRRETRSKTANKAGRILPPT